MGWRSRTPGSRAARRGAWRATPRAQPWPHCAHAAAAPAPQEAAARPPAAEQAPPPRSAPRQAGRRASGAAQEEARAAIGRHADKTAASSVNNAPQRAAHHLIGVPQYLLQGPVRRLGRRRLPWAGLQHGCNSERARRVSKVAREHPLPLLRPRQAAELARRAAEHATPQGRAEAVERSWSVSCLPPRPGRVTFSHPAVHRRRSTFACAPDVAVAKRSRVFTRFGGVSAARRA